MKQFLSPALLAALAASSLCAAHAAPVDITRPDDLPATLNTAAFKGTDLKSLRLPAGMGVMRKQSAWTLLADASILPDVGRKNPHITTDRGYRMEGTNPGKCAFGLNLGAAYEFAPQWHATMGYHLETTGDSTQQNANIGILRTF